MSAAFRHAARASERVTVHGKQTEIAKQRDQRPRWNDDELRCDSDHPREIMVGYGEPRCFSVPTTTGDVLVEDTMDGIVPVHADESINEAVLVAFTRWLNRVDELDAEMSSETRGAYDPASEIEPSAARADGGR